MDRKQEIQNQIAELRRELESLENGVEVRFDLIESSGRVICVNAESSSERDVISAIESWLNANDFENKTAQSLAVIVSTNHGPWLNWHITRNVSYSITPF